MDQSQFNAFSGAAIIIAFISGWNGFYWVVVYPLRRSLAPEFRDWQKNHTTLTVHKRDLSLSEGQYIKQIENELSHSRTKSVVRIEAQFWLEYSSEISNSGLKQNDSSISAIAIPHAARAEVSETHRGFNYQF